MEVKPGYKQTDVGVIPEEWEACSVRQKGEVITGKALAVNGPGMQRPYLRTKNVFDGRIDINDVLTMPMTDEQFAQFQIRAGDVLLNEGQSLELVGRCAMYQDEYPEPCAIQNALLRFRARQGVSGTFASYLFRHCQHTGVFARIALQTTSVAHLGGSRFERLALAWPPESEQRAIAEALNDVDGLLGGLDRLIDKKRDLKQATMQQLLTGQTRLPGFHGEWEVKRLGELFNFSGGYSASRDQLSSEGHCYLHYGDIHGATKTTVDVRADYQNIPKLDIPLKRVSSKSLLEDGDVVFVDASEDDEGTSRHVVVVNKDNRPFISGLHTIVAKSKTDELAHEYRRYCFQTAAIRQQFLFYAVGTKVSGISKTNIAKLTLPVPSVPEQTAIAEVLTDMDAELAALEQRREKARALKQAMMQELLTGRIRLVSLADNIVPLPRTRTTNKPDHNWQIDEAVIIGVLANQFGTEPWPLPRKRRVKLTYLLHRHSHRRTNDYRKKAAGPYNPKSKYQGPEGIALKNDYVRQHHNGKYSGFVVGGKVEQAERYFADWYPGEKEWLEQFRFEKTDELELLATIDMAIEDLRSESKAVDLATVKQLIHDHPEWEAKLDREIFSDDNITRAIQRCGELFSS